jgi:hypothetical protein
MKGKRARPQAAPFVVMENNRGDRKRKQKSASFRLGRKVVPQGRTNYDAEAEPRHTESVRRTREGRIVERRKAAGQGTRKQRGEIPGYRACHLLLGR